MSERRFPPSAARIDEARRRGDVAVSPALLRAAATLAGLAALVAALPRIAARLLDLARHAFTAAGRAAPAAAPPDANTVLGPLRDEAWSALAWSLAPVLGAALLAALVAGVAQTRALFTTATFSRRAQPLREGAVTALALTLATLAGLALAIAAERDSFTAALAAGGTAPLTDGARVLGRVALRTACALAAAAVADAVLRHLRWRRSLWMTRAEAQAERRADEGDPMLRRERLRLHRALGARDLAADVAAARVLLTTFDGAVGLRLDEGRPRVTCVARGLNATRVLDIARRIGVPVRADDLLAPPLLSLAPGAAVPPDLAARARALLAR